MIVVTSASRSWPEPDRRVFCEGFAAVSHDLFMNLDLGEPPAAHVLALDLDDPRAAPRWLDARDDAAVPADFARLKTLLHGRAALASTRQRVIAAQRDDASEHFGFDAAGLVYRCGTPVQRGALVAVPVLAFAASALREIPSLEPQRTVAPRAALCTNLVDAAIELLFEEATRELTQDRPGYRLGTWAVSEAELRRAAGAAVLWVAELAALPLDEITRRVPPRALFDHCNAIAALDYERRQPRGRLVIARRGHPDVVVALAFARGIPLGEHRWARKALELSTSKLALLTDGTTGYGLGTIAPGYDGRTQDVFEVEFRGRQRWLLRHGPTTLLRSIHGLPSLLRLPVREAAFVARFRAMHPTTTAADARAVWSTVFAIVTAQRHGALVIVHPAAADEATRLGDQATRIEPVRLDARAVRAVVKIDGAVLLDVRGVCHAVGVILDGTAASVGGNAGRGARYNSAVRYVASQGRGVLAVIVSDDRTIDVVPAP